MVRYYALTTTNAQHGWKPLAGPCATRADAESEGRAKIGDIRTEIGTDIYRETEQKNLHVVPSSELRRFDTNEDYVLDQLARED